MKKEKICYAYAHGRLHSSLNHLVSNLEMACRRKDIKVNREVFEMLEDMIQAQRKKAIVESYAHS